MNSFQFYKSTIICLVFLTYWLIDSHLQLFIGGAGPSGYSPTSPTYSPTSPSYDTEEGEPDDKKKAKGKSKGSKKKWFQEV